MGLEGIVSKRKDSAYRSGRSPDWLKMKNLDAPAVKREAGSSFDQGQRPSHGPRCGHQYDRGCEHQPQQTENIGVAVFVDR